MSIANSIHPAGNQDQFVDNVAISGTTLTVTLATNATATNTYKVTVWEPKGETMSSKVKLTAGVKVEGNWYKPGDVFEGDQKTVDYLIKTGAARDPKAVDEVVDTSAAETKAKEIVAAAEAEAEKVADKAKEDAEAAVAQAEAEADRVVKEAQDAAKKVEKSKTDTESK